jgi:hypothetical protein
MLTTRLLGSKLGKPENRLKPQLMCSGLILTLSIKNPALGRKLVLAEKRVEKYLV